MITFSNDQGQKITKAQYARLYAVITPKMAQAITLLQSGYELVSNQHDRTVWFERGEERIATRSALITKLYEQYLIEAAGESKFHGPADINGRRVMYSLTRYRLTNGY